MKKNSIWIASALLLGLSASEAFSAEQIVRPFLSPRSAGMGGVRYMTGFYDENFFGNPARTTENPETKVQILQTTVATSAGTINNMSATLDAIGGDTSALASAAGSNLYLQVQEMPLAWYRPKLFQSNVSAALAVFISTQAAFDIRKSYELTPFSMTDVEADFQIGSKFLDKQLAVGVNVRAGARLSSKSNYFIADLLQQSDFGDALKGGSGIKVDGDIGAIYTIPWSFHDNVLLEAGMTVSNVLGSDYSTGLIKSFGTEVPMKRPRTLALGVAAHIAEVGIFRHNMVSLEFQEIGNNTNGGLMRTVHLGTEWNWNRLALRGGLYQGYLSAGVGLDLYFFTLDVATWGEELTLNVGGRQDRRYALKFGFEI
jgi:hypothetical protein